MTTTLQSLLIEQTQQQVFDLLIAVMQANGFPTTAWVAGTPERTELMAFSRVLVDLVTNYVPTIAGGGFLDYATTNWLRLKTEQDFNLPYNQATFTEGNMLFTTASGSGPYPATGLRVTFGASGNRYIIQSGTIPLSGSISLPVKAEHPGASYNDPSSSGDITLIDSLPGVTVTNPAGIYSAVDHVGSGTGTLSLGGSPTGSHQVLVQIDSTGASGVAGWSYQLDGGPFVSAGTASSITNLGGVGINITLVGASSLDFVEHDTFLVSTPGSWITAQGSDDESDSNLVTRARNRWSSLSDIATEEYYALLATSTPSVGSQVTQVIVQIDANINNRVNIVIAGPNGPLPGGTVTAVEAYVASRPRITDFPVVQSPAGLDVVIAGTVQVAFAQRTTAQAAAQVALADLVNGTVINGTIRISKIIELLMEITGVQDVIGITINGVAANLVLGSPTTFVLAALTLPLSLAWVPV